MMLKVLIYNFFGYQILSMFIFRRKLQCQALNYSTFKKEIVFTAAVRTPINEFQNNSTRLGAIAINAAVKQAALPSENVNAISLGNILADHVDDETMFGRKVKKPLNRFYYENGLSAFLGEIERISNNTNMSSILAAKIMKSSEKCDNIASGSTLSQPLVSQFQSEIVPVTIRQRQEPKLLTILNDELQSTAISLSGAVALTMTTSANAASLNVTPLARIVDIGKFTIQNLSQSIEKLLMSHNLKLQDIRHWKCSSGVEQNVIQNLNMDTANVNQNNRMNIFDLFPSPDVFMLQMTHLLHTMQAKDLACVIAEGLDRLFAVILIEKLPLSVSDDLPVLTLYTKDPCSLCDTLVEELEQNFKNEFHLEKVFIDQKENVRFLRLFRYDIPVLFLNNQFLCMHSLKRELLRHKLDNIKSEKQLLNTKNI